MNQLFYSDKEGILFWVAGYTIVSGEVSKIIEMLSTYSQRFAEIADVDVTAVKTFVVTKSQHYNCNRVFYVETNTVPENTFRLGLENDWTMAKWVEN